MAKCKLCKTNIPEGSTYCETCLEENATKTNESYLDSLLNSVINTAPAAETTYKKYNHEINEKAPAKSENKIDNSLDLDDMFSFEIDLEDLEDFDEYDITNDLEDSIEISNEVLFGDSLKEEEVTLDGQASQPPETKEEEDHLVQDNISTQEIANYDTMEEYDPALSDLLDQLDLSDVQSVEELSRSDEQGLSGIDQSDDSDLVERDENIEFNLENGDEIQSSQETEAQTEEFSQEEGLSQEEETDDDLLDLLNQISSEDPVSDDIQAISELLSGRAPSLETEKANVPSDVGEVFSDALKVVSSLDDPDIDELSALDFLESATKENEKIKKKKVKKAKVKKEKVKKTKAPKEEIAGPKQTFIERIFGNVEEEEPKKKASLAKVEQAATKEKAKKKSKGKDKNAATTEGKNEDDLTDKPVVDKKAAKLEAKKEKKEKKKKEKEIIQVIDEVDEDEGRINRVGASIVFIFFGIMVTVLLIGTNIFSYSLSIQNATSYFDRHKYTQAYNEVYGRDIKDEDIELYEKIQTVMFVNKQLNSYNNYYLMGKYPEALDSLLKGLSRYDKYILLASMLGIESDLDYVRNQIIAELNRVFHITEDEALEIINSSTKAQYSVRVYNVVLERMDN